MHEFCLFVVMMALMYILIKQLFAVNMLSHTVFTQCLKKQSKLFLA